MPDNPWRSKGAAAVAAGLVLIAGLGARVAHLGPFAETIARNGDVAAMTYLTFRDNVGSMRQGTVLEKQAVEIACAFFTSLSQTGEPPAEWTSFRGAMVDRAGASPSGSYFDNKVDQIEVAVDIAQRSPRAAVKYAEYCF